jgi:hypothetical protein
VGWWNGPNRKIGGPLLTREDGGVEYLSNLEGQLGNLVEASFFH